MKAQSISKPGFLYSRASATQEAPQGGEESFRSALDKSVPLNMPAPTGFAPAPASECQGNIIMPSTFLLAQSSSQSPSPVKDAAAAYAQQASLGKDPKQMSGYEIYKDDQLLRNPGGDHYYFEENKLVETPKDQESFLGRVAKDVSDAFGNIKNFLGNFFMGSKIRYRNENNQVKEGTQRGLIGTFCDFFKDLGSGLSFGLWHPDDEKGPQGAMERFSFFGSKLKKAILGDVLVGVPQSVNHMGKNIILAGWNLVEVLPDATVGNFDAGKKLTTTIFDNGQVMVEYLTDVIPSGDAWFRVHASSLKELKPPVLYNLGMPEHSTGDTRWQYVRNTPFRKTIETIGTLLADVAAIGLAGQTGFSSNQNNEKKELLMGLSEAKNLLK